MRIKNNLNLSLNNSSFGYHSSGSIEHGSVGHLPMSEQMTRLINSIRKVAFIALVTLGILTAMGIASIMGLVVGIAGFVGISAFYYSSQYWNYRHICKTAGIVFQNAEQVKKFEVSGIQGKCEVLPTEHCADTEVWRRDLIKAAEHNIVLSGNYCGGKSFAELLELLKKKIIEKQNFKIVIISSPTFIKNGNLKSVQKLTELYPNNFSLIESPDIWHISTGLKKSTNHTKGLVIDYGKYFILGGSGIKDNFAETGLDNLTKEEFLNQKKLEWENDDKTNRQADSNFYVASSLSHNLNEFKGASNPGEDFIDLSATKQIQIENPNGEDGLMGKIIPGNFRDMDFVFRCQGGKSPSGKQVYKQLLLLGYRWEKYNKMLNKRSLCKELNVNDLGVFTGCSTEISPSDSLVVQLLKTPIPRWESIKTRVPHFEKSSKKSSEVAFQVFASGPEHHSSKFAEELEKRIKRARKQIVINHMYFQPTTQIMNELKNAIIRGVKIKIITAGIYKDCPNSHLGFGPRNKYNYSYLVNSLPHDKRNNVEVYEFQQKKKGNHKKIIIIDDRVIAGSSNLGYKSLHTASDHELNFFARSQQFVDETMKICDIDIKHSLKIEDPTKLSIQDYVQAAFHRILAPLIG